MGTALVRFTPRIGDIVMLREDHPHAIERAKYYRPDRWRVTGYMKKHTPEPPKGDSFMDRLIRSILEEASREIDAGKGRTRLKWCDATQAEYITGSGIAGCIYPIEDVIVVGRVPWSESYLAYSEVSSRRNWGEVLF
ncbi:hypothetical protein [Mesorhizobium sp. M8A.F.Ca.ET.021.01.1.1]|uniref:hypothetical protein n=1 Tax=Mesorhizobium sp. M8A.F.Ca.ET.021.01.1.1 TaxID=2496757 RepID=UPI00167C1EF0|nr:hypothetical protein [Mesorhizobium sp. M8A.F.Ca.ET.021.01.1.1]